MILGAVFFTILLVTGNTMSQAVRERTGELGVLKAIGFTNSQVLALVLSESCLLAVLGGGLGLGVAWLLVARGDPTGGMLPLFSLPTGDVLIGVALQDRAHRRSTLIDLGLAALLCLPLMVCVQVIADRTALSSGKSLGALALQKYGSRGRKVVGGLLIGLLENVTVGLAPQPRHLHARLDFGQNGVDVTGEFGFGNAERPHIHDHSGYSSSSASAVSACRL